jgi:hypothetical protein
VLVLASTLSAGCTSDSASLSDEYPTLSIGQVSRPEPVEYEPYFDQVSIRGQTYTLPIPVQELLDAGWVFYGEDHTDREWVQPFSGIWSTLVPADDPDANHKYRGIDVVIINATPDSIRADSCDVWRVSIADGFDTEPYPGIHAGASEAEVAAALDISQAVEAGPVPIQDSWYSVYREALTAEERLDLSAGSSSADTRSTGRAQVRVNFTGGTMSSGYGASTSGYTVKYAPPEAMTNGYVTVPAWRPLWGDSRCETMEYIWHIPSDLSTDPTVVDGIPILVSGWEQVPDADLAFFYDSAADFFTSYVDGSAMYSIDGHDYAMAAANVPFCTEIAGTSTSSPEDLVFAGLEDATMVDVAPQKMLLWEDERSTAGVLVYRGAGPSTGQETMQVVVSYCDWEHGTRMTFLYSLLALEPDTKISDGAANLLLTVASDATRSITYTPPAP